MVHRARKDRSTRPWVDRSVEVRPTMPTRLIEARGCTMMGGVPTLGRARICVIRSCTIWRALSALVPGWKTTSMAERPGVDVELMWSTQGTPFNRSCSSGTVTRDSTSAADNPSASVCTCTAVGVNSG
jgi:hypothetical protein